MLIYNIMVAAYAISLFMSVLAIYISITDAVTYQMYRVKMISISVAALVISFLVHPYV